MPNIVIVNGRLVKYILISNKTTKNKQWKTDLNIEIF